MMLRRAIKLKEKHIGSIFSKGKMFFYDQAICSLSNFASMFLLAKFMGPRDFGVFVLFNSTMLFALGLINALVGMPLQVFYHEHSRKAKERYYTSMFIINSALILLSIPLLLLFYYLYKGLSINIYVQLLFPLTIFFFTTQDFLRKVAMVRHKTTSLVLSDTVSFLLRVGFIVGIGLMFKIDLLTVIILYGLLFFLGAIILYQRLVRINFHEVLQSFKTNFSFARWKITEQLLFFFTTTIYIYVAGLVLGPELLGIYATVEIFSRFSNLFVYSTNNYSLSSGTRYLKERGKASFFKFLKNVYGKVFFILVFGSAIILILGKWLLEWVYGTEISAYFILLPLLVIRIFLNFFSQPIRVIFNIFKQPKYIVYSYLVSTIVTMALIYPLLSKFSIIGIAIGNIIAYSALFITHILFFRRLRLK